MRTMLIVPDPIAVPTLLSVALNLAPTTSAPVSSLMASHARAQHMPWPTEAVIRSGLLFRMNGSMTGVGDLGRIAVGKLVAAHLYRMRACAADVVKSRTSRSASSNRRGTTNTHITTQRSGARTTPRWLWTSTSTLIQTMIRWHGH